MKLFRTAPPVLLVLVALGAPLVAHGEGLSFLARFPDLSPDGRTIAFCTMGDVWTVPAGGGTASRITVHEAYDHSPHWSPDGQTIAFSSNRHGNDDLFVIDRRGGPAERLTHHSGGDQIADWDGGGVLFLSRHESLRPHLYRTRDGGNGIPDEVFADRLVEAAASPDGEWLAIVRGWTPWWRKHYRGKASRDIWLRPMSGGESVRITQWEGDDDDPMWAPGGASLFYISEGTDSVANIWRVGIDTGGGTAAARAARSS